jgi:hypothetical protein
MNPCGRVAFTCVALPSFPISCQQKVAAPFQSAQERTPRFDEPANLAFQGKPPHDQNRPRARKQIGSTVPGKGYFVVLRLYGPTEAVINKSWKPGDIEKTQ